MSLPAQHRQFNQQTKQKQKKQSDSHVRRPTTIVFFDWFGYPTLYYLFFLSFLNSILFRDDTLLPSTVLLSNKITLQNPYISEEVQSELKPLQDQIISILDSLKKTIKYFFIVTNAEVSLLLLLPNTSHITLLFCRNAGLN